MATMNLRTVVYGALFGALGGAIGWLPGEALALFRPETTWLRYAAIALYFVVVSGCIGAAVGAVDGVLGHDRTRLWRTARLGVAFGIVGGAVGSVPGEFTFEMLSRANVNLSLIGRAAGWAIVGVFIGAIQGIATQDRTRLLRGALGGLLGGYLGGGFFDIVNAGVGQGTLSRLIADVLLGLFLGALIAFFQEWLAEAWLVVTSPGPQEGQKYNLTKSETVLGRGDRDDFVLFASPDVATSHAVIVRQLNGYFIRPMHAHNPVWVAGQPVAGEIRLRPGVEVRLGSLTLRYHEQARSCARCGAPVAMSTKFCPRCGATVGGT
jgi:hypothetical protein